MECRLVSQLPEGEEWRYELKLDGYRALALIRDKEVHLLSRHNNDLASQFPRVYTALQQSRLPDGVLDGEIVALDAEGRPSFQQLQNSRSADASIVFYVFDVLNYAGRDTTGLPLRERKRLLERLSASLAEPVRVSTVLEARVADILQQVASFGLEGVVAKRADSIYQPGKRPGSWVKYRSNEKEDFFIGGYLPGKNYFDAILVGHYKGKQLMFVKKLRNGFVPHTRKEVFAAIAPLRVPRCPFVNLPEPNTRRGAVDSEQMKQCVWVKPQVKCEVEFTEWTAGGRLRHAAFRQLVR
jgi:bifunctional non-homologous end joining protein LigD